MPTTKQLNALVFAYILNCIDGEGYGKQLTTDTEKFQFLADTFKSEYAHPEILRRNGGSYLRTFIEWMRGLPSCFNVDFENYHILEIARQWGTLAPDASESKEDKILDNWWNFIANKTFQLMKRHKVLPY